MESIQRFIVSLPYFLANVKHFSPETFSIFILGGFSLSGLSRPAFFKTAYDYPTKS